MANRAQQLAALVREQAEDAHTHRLPRVRRQVRIVADEIAARPQDGPWAILEGLPGWSMEAHALARLKGGTCPVCHGRDLEPTEYCLGCDATGSDGRVVWPGLPVGYTIDPDAPAEPTVYRPTPLPVRRAPGRRTA